VCEEIARVYNHNEAIRRDERAQLVKEGKCRCSWSECICGDKTLWPKPDYKVGQVWALYGAFEKTVEYTIEIVTPYQLVLSYYSPMLKKLYTVMDYHPGQYARSGTPELRVKLKDVALPVSAIITHASNDKTPCSEHPLQHHFNAHGGPCTCGQFQSKEAAYAATGVGRGPET
jgi:hypothetical protein